MNLELKTCTFQEHNITTIKIENQAEEIRIVELSCQKIKSSFNNYK